MPVVGLRGDMAHRPLIFPTAHLLRVLFRRKTPSLRKERGRLGHPKIVRFAQDDNVRSARQLCQSRSRRQIEFVTPLNRAGRDGRRRPPKERLTG
jgi:hypothetical protein